MVAPFTVLCLMIYYAALNLNFSGRKIPLEILHVGLGVPQAPFDKRKQREFLCGGTGIRQCDLLHLASSSQRHEEQLAHPQPVLFSGYARISHPMTALIKIKRSAARLPSRTPERIAVINVKIASAVIHRNAVIPVAQDTPEFGVLAETIASGSG